MSVFTKAIKVHGTLGIAGEYYNPPKLFAKVFKISTGYSSSIPESGRVDTVTLVAKFEAKCEFNPHIEGAASEAEKMGKKILMQAVFGEFREHFSEINYALYSGNFEEAKKLLSDFESYMFER